MGLILCFIMQCVDIHHNFNDTLTCAIFELNGSGLSVI